MSLSGYWSLYGAFSIGVSAESHILSTETKEVFSINLPFVGGWDLPDLPRPSRAATEPTEPTELTHRAFGRAFMRETS